MIAFLTATVIRCRRAARLQSGSSSKDFSTSKERRHSMEWVQPDFEEISLACEINSYAEATL
jgi:coenzyme PQQ precursor peptide PqqA